MTETTESVQSNRRSSRNQALSLLLVHEEPSAFGQLLIVWELVALWDDIVWHKFKRQHKSLASRRAAAHPTLSFESTLKKYSFAPHDFSVSV